MFHYIAMKQMKQMKPNPTDEKPNKERTIREVIN